MKPFIIDDFRNHISNLLRNAATNMGRAAGQAAFVQIRKESDADFLKSDTESLKNAATYKEIQRKIEKLQSTGIPKLIELDKVKSDIEKAIRKSGERETSHGYLIGARDIIDSAITSYNKTFEDYKLLKEAMAPSSSLEKITHHMPNATTMAIIGLGVASLYLGKRFIFSNSTNQARNVEDFTNKNINFTFTK